VATTIVDDSNHRSFSHTTRIELMSGLFEKVHPAQPPTHKSPAAPNIPGQSIPFIIPFRTSCS
jgi:hypothetical protein